MMEKETYLQNFKLKMKYVFWRRYSLAIRIFTITHCLICIRCHYSCWYKIVQSMCLLFKSVVITVKNRRMYFIPKQNSLKICSTFFSAVFSNCLAFIPAIFLFVSRFGMKNDKLKWVKIGIDVLAIAAQLSGIFIVPILFWWLQSVPVVVTA